MPPTLHPHLLYIPCSLYKHYPLPTIQEKKSTHPNLFLFCIHSKQDPIKKEQKRGMSQVSQRKHMHGSAPSLHLSTWIHGSQLTLGERWAPPTAAQRA